MANTITITGNLTREPEIRYTKEGQATAQLGVAVNRRWQDRATQEWQGVTGRLDQRSWETEDGEHRYKVEITADEIGPSLRFATADVQRTERRSVLDVGDSDSMVDSMRNGDGSSPGSVPVEA